MEIEAKEEMLAPVTLVLAEIEVVMEILDQVEADQVKVQVISQMLEISLNLVENVVENLNQIPVVLAVEEEEGIKYIH